ncbi:phospholipid-transporting ATPase ABCA3 [Dermacentor silvarum]|uniref:phospholipid-transporting ATPase ABCA3 n=1 Tax=Dermacentor silvarum TaxID=543639 RepID=UPI002100F2CC|nr:phospholipid-transporting ATPase ABCA3 [Dermacentor silvarum]
MIFMASGYLPSRHALASQELPAEQDVEEEKKRVNAARQQEGLAGYSLLAWSLHKWFGTLHAVRGIYLALRPSECFGLLGVNGAGKTTTFQMLAALISVSNGDAVTAVARLSGNVRQWQSQISYCFQLGGLLDRMNAYEYLYLVGRLRGIPENELKPMIDSVLSVVDLTEHASKECGVYSGGNRRKLSIAAALLGLPPLVFLDEPYAGVDVVSRNKIFRAIAEIKKHSQTTFVLTSHNMDECEFSCDRLTIMVSGQMMCLGTLQHLREKFGQGYRLEFFFKPSVTFDEAKFKHSVEKQFPGIQLKGAQKICRGYGFRNPQQDHNCEAEYQLCGKDHLTGDKKCKARYKMPYLVIRRRWERRRREAAKEEELYYHNNKEAIGSNNNHNHKKAASKQPSIDEKINRNNYEHDPGRDRSGSFPRLSGETGRGRGLPPGSGPDHGPDQGGGRDMVRALLVRETGAKHSLVTISSIKNDQARANAIAVLQRLYEVPERSAAQRQGKGNKEAKMLKESEEKEKQQESHPNMEEAGDGGGGLMVGALSDGR